VKTLITLTTALCALALAGPALAAPGGAATLDGAALTLAEPTGMKATCQYDLTRWNASVAYGASGIAAGPYAGTFTQSGTARLSTVSGTGSLTAVDATFTIASSSGLVTGTLRFGYGVTSGTGTCDDAKQDATIHATGVVYTAALPDGTIDSGTVELSLSDVPASAGYVATFRSTGRILDGDGDAVSDAVDNCPAVPNTDQFDTDDDRIGDACDSIDDRPSEILRTLRDATAAAGVNLVSKVDHAIAAWNRGDVRTTCSDLAAYVDGVRAKRGKSIPAATADRLLDLAGHAQRRICG
jgi:hypothetical protein